MLARRCPLALLLLLLSGCSSIAIALAPSREPEAPSEATERGERLLAEALLDGAYDRLPEVLTELTRLAIEHPRDGRLHTALGMAHLWRASEKARDPASTPRLTEHVVLSRHYLTSARALLPDDARVHGWSAGAMLATATLLDDARARR